MSSGNLSKVTQIGSNAFFEAILTEADLSKVTDIGTYAFAYCEKLTALKLNNNGVSIGEGAFAYAQSLKDVTNLNKATVIGDYSFAYTSITSADISAAEYIGTHAFIKDKVTDFTVILGSSVKQFGDNPFALCRIAPFSTEATIEFNGKEYKTEEFTYDINESIKVINGSLYQSVPYGLELVCYAGEGRDESVADNTVRISAFAFAGSEIKNVILPYTVFSIGHKAFYDCQNLSLITFTSYKAPILEEEYDYNYYASLQNIPATGDYTVTETDSALPSFPGKAVREKLLLPPVSVRRWPCWANVPFALTAMWACGILTWLWGFPIWHSWTFPMWHKAAVIWPPQW